MGDNIRKRVQRVLYSTISGSEDAPYTDDGDTYGPFGLTNSNTIVAAAPASGVGVLELDQLELQDSSKVQLAKNITSSIVGSSYTNILTSPVDYMYNCVATLTEWIASSSQRCWIVLIVAIFIEIYATTLMKIAVDSKNAVKTLTSIMIYLISLLMFGVSLRQIDVGIAYAIWSAVGTASVAIFGILMFGEAYTTGKIVSLTFILTGVVGLNLQENH